jgi:hypothetical protein
LGFMLFSRAALMSTCPFSRRVPFGQDFESARRLRRTQLSNEIGELADPAGFAGQDPAQRRGRSWLGARPRRRFDTDSAQPVRAWRVEFDDAGGVCAMCRARVVRRGNPALQLVKRADLNSGSAHPTCRIYREVPLGVRPQRHGFHVGECVARLTANVRSLDVRQSEDLG